jgi:predicted metal-binding protein
MLQRPPMDKYAQRALAAGARDAKLIPTDTVITGHWVRLKCQYGCGGYGQCLTCPPYSPPPDTTAEMLREYGTALLVHGDGHARIRELLPKLERRAFLDGYYKAFAMAAGPCDLCRLCPVEEQECRHPEAARPAMEACGIDVFATARQNGFPAEVVKNSGCQQNYYGLLLLE